MSNPWKVRGTRVVYENPWIRVREDQVICPDGRPGIYGVVETRIATGIVALTEKLEVYLVGQYRYPTNHYSWEIVEGGSNPGEAPIDSVRRELREEAGLTAKKVFQLGDEVHLSNCFSSEVGFLYLGFGLHEGTSEPEGTEVLQVKKVPLIEALQLVHNGEVKDSLSIIGLLRAEKFLRGRGCL